MNKAVFLDRDGTINEEVNYLSKKEHIKLIPGVREALETFKNLGFLNIIITNQSGIARGFIKLNDLEEIHSELNTMLRIENVNLIDDIFFCPYHVEGVLEEFRKESEDRKPNTGMIVKAKKKYNLDLSRSFLIGDSFTDMKCAVNSNIKKILVKTGYGKEALEMCRKEGIELEYVASDILDASVFIKEHVNNSR
jgi:D,D-heptose 1,7-bisphosphate phosphatase